MWLWSRDKDEAFYEDLCNKYYERIYFYCLRLVKGQDQFTDFVEECTQNTFLEARKQLSKLKKHPNVAGWLYTTAHNLINNEYRDMYIKKKYEITMDDHSSNTFSQFDDQLESIFNSSIDLDKICVEVLNKLKPHEYELYIDYYKNNMSVSEISRKNNISATATTTRIYRLKKKIRNIIRAYFEENNIYGFNKR